MTKDKVLSNRELKSLFIQDNELPITVLEEPYFSQRLIILDPLFHCRMAFKRFCDELGFFFSADSYLEYRKRTVAKVLREITERSRASLRKLDTASFEDLLGDVPIPYGADGMEDFYSVKNCGKVFLRVRLRNGCLTVLHRFLPDAFETDSWDMLLDRLDSHLRHSRLVRRSFSSMLSGGRLAQLTMCCLYMEAEKIRKNFGLEPACVFPDEILYELGSDSGVKYSDLQSILDPSATAEIFRLRNLKSIGFMEEFMAGSAVPIRLVNVDPNIAHQLITYYFRDILMADDLVINYNGQLATMHEPIPNPWEIRAL